jgi:hypothetical protein
MKTEENQEKKTTFIISSQRVIRKIIDPFVKLTFADKHLDLLVDTGDTHNFNSTETVNNIQAHTTTQAVSETTTLGNGSTMKVKQKVQIDGTLAVSENTITL